MRTSNLRCFSPPRYIPQPDRRVQGEVCILDPDYEAEVVVSHEGFRDSRESVLQEGYGVAVGEAVKQRSNDKEDPQNDEHLKPSVAQASQTPRVRML